MKSASKIAAVGGVTAALAVIIMCLGTLIPVATYVCPMICALLLESVLRLCGERAGWAWYGAVSILCALLSPDKEAAAVFAFLGYYPIVKPRLDRLRLRWLWKLILFNCSGAAMYGILIYVFGMQNIVEELQELGLVLGALCLVLGNVTFFLLDHLLSKRSLGKRHG